MKFTPTDIAGAFTVETAPIADARGDFARSFCTEEFQAAGISFRVAQTNISRNPRRGTLRGMHYQADPTPDPKLVRCTRGHVFDVAIDLRPRSETFCRWTGAVLRADRQNALFVPAGCAHGFLTLEDDCEIEYLMGAPYVAELARGVRWDDPAFAIAWPESPALMSDRDAAYPDFAAEVRDG